MENRMYFFDSEIRRATFLLRVNLQQQTCIIHKTNRYSTKFERRALVTELISKKGISYLANRKLEKEITLN